MSGPLLLRCTASTCYTWHSPWVLGSSRCSGASSLACSAATAPRLLHWPHEKTDWEKDHARDRSCFAVACFNAGGLHKKDGAWHGLPGGKPVSSMTTADLARDGMLTVTTNHRFGSARLTERGNWFARTLLCQGTTANSESVRFGSCSPVPTW